MPARVSRGRQKIDIRRIENESNRHVTFSKRRTGAFKKASELCILTGAEMAVIIKSPGNNIFTFGHPSVEAIGDRYLFQNAGAPANIDAVENFMKTIRNIRLNNLNAEYTGLKKELLEHTKKAKVLNMMIRDDQAEHRHKRSLASMTKDELGSYKKDLLMLHDIVSERFEEMQQGIA